MRQIISLALFIALATSCKQPIEPLVSKEYVDSLVENYSPSASAITNKDDLAFWEKRMDSLPDNFVNGPKYAAALSLRFHLYGDIHDLLKADSLFIRANLANGEKEDGILYTLANFSMQQHRFKQAADFTTKAIDAGDNRYGGQLALFDAAFETGDYDVAGSILKTIKPADTYPVYFRRSKYEHYKGTLDSAVFYMMRAVEKSSGNRYLEQIALSNAADLNVHKADLKQAYELYRKSIAIDRSDFHSIMGIGWIALMHDKNDTLATKLFSFVHGKLRSPDPLLKMMQVAEFNQNSEAERKLAEEFTRQATQPEYGLMYNKYLIEIYTGILNDPAKADSLAQKEIENRATPQTYAWLAWSFLQNNQKEKALEIYDQHISGKPLEGLELYYMGKLMKAVNKGYNAQQFFKAAYDNRYDLSPGKINDLEKNLE